MFEWPENILPLPSFNFDIDAEFSNIRSKMDSGRVRQRPRFSRELELSSIKFELTRQEFAWFKAAWVHKLNRGNDWFLMRLPVANDEKLTLSEVRFVSDYKANHRPVGNWDITATIEYQESAMFTADELDLAILYDGDYEEAQNQIDSLDGAFPADWTL